jgi:signal transduction histidine kinase
MSCGKAAFGSPERGRSVEPVRRAARRIAALTEKLLAFARHEGHDMGTVDLNAMIRQVAELMESVADIRIEIVVDACPGKAMVMADATQIRNALLNLAFNALDAMKEGGRLGFGTECVEMSEERVRVHSADAAGGRYVKLTVWDTGTGMSDEVRAKAFEPFFSTKLAGNELGLGLSGVHGCVKHHHGFVEVNSTVDAGTRIEMYFPGLMAR